MKKIKPIEIKGNTVHINLAASESNADWIRAARLLEAAEAGDEEARKEFERMDQAPTFIDDDDGKIKKKKKKKKRL